ncbi:MAG: 2-succinyl-5-enolpyruvyl-6-hydroxy-3-cyclohexene-1-carboxylic-acid synthase [Thaumarchaeota archaeon]|nr:2-succinyl-5-enolpyruvyl-6-hydroxy-3-cyclohexene-1-carboxylic-acid synthase [Nitrososphaerota archaeon]
MEEFDKYSQSLVDGLHDGGIRNVVICPGSRSTPVALAFVRRADAVRPWILYDERSAAFFALGMARSSSTPVALVCTSGSAAANFLPAVVEAKLGRVPLVVITADRPPELRGFGGAQTIDQIGLFGSHVKWFQDMPVAADLPELHRYSRMVGARASHIAVSSPAGPIHINFSFREPLLAGGAKEAGTPDVGVAVARTRALADERDIRRMVSEIKSDSRGVIVVGPGRYEGPVRDEISRLAKMLMWPVLPDVLSNLRQDSHPPFGLVAGYEFLVRNKAFSESNRPQWVIRLGEVPTSKELNSFCEGATTVVMDEGDGWRDPDFAASKMIFGELVHSISSLRSALRGLPPPSKDWLDEWLSADEQVKELAAATMDKMQEPFEGKLFHEISRKLAPSSPLTVVVGSSMPVRDLDCFFMRGDKNLRFIANRGANGIDGVVSTAMGVSALEGDVLLILGDVSFYHDMNGLLASKLHGLNATVLIVNNRGGGIFSFLAQHSLPNDLFEQLFGESHDLDFSGIRTIYGGEFHRVSDWDSFEKSLASSLAGRGLRVVEFMAPERERNLVLHREAFQAISSFPARSMEKERARL